MGEEVVATDGEISLCVTENQVRSFWAGGLEPPAGAISDNGDGGINYLAADEPELEIGPEPEHEDMHVDLPLTTSACASDGPGSTPVTTNQKGSAGVALAIIKQQALDRVSDMQASLERREH